jgi:hypothetical protein
MQSDAKNPPLSFPAKYSSIYDKRASKIDTLGHGERPKTGGRQKAPERLPQTELRHY